MRSCWTRVSFSSPVSQAITFILIMVTAAFAIPVAARADHTATALAALRFGGMAQELAGRELFGRAAIVTGRPDDIARWRSFEARFSKERASIAACLADQRQCATGRARAWSQLVRRVKLLPQAAQLNALNAGINGLARHVSDAAIYGVSDYWAAPLEFLARDGDCEDFVLLKLISLEYLGYADDQLRVVVVMDMERNLPHAVLAVSLAAEAFILDTSADAVSPASSLAQFVPHYAFNFTSRWGFVAGERSHRPIQVATR